MTFFIIHNDCGHLMLLICCSILQSVFNTGTLLVNFQNKKKQDMGTTEFFKTTGENLLKKVKELIDEGNVRRITVTEKSGRELMSFPLTVGVVGAILAPVLAAVGALAALIGECTIAVERESEV
jgi:hypothetical protein